MGKVTGTVVTKKYKGSGRRAQGAGLRAQGSGHRARGTGLSFTDSHAGPQAVAPFEVMSPLRG